MIEFRYLPAFFAVAESGSFTTAAKKLFIATSAVSRQVRLLEEACGTQLFFRTARETALTESGKLLYKEMRHFQGQAEEIIGRRTRRQLNIGTLQGVLHRWLIPLIASERYFEDPNFRIEVARPEALVEGVESGTIDIAFFSYATLTAVPASLRVVQLFKEEITLISKKRISLKNLDKYPWISLSTNDWLYRHLGRPSKRGIVVNDMLAAVELVRQGLGIAMVPSYMIKGISDIHSQPVRKFEDAAICLLMRHYERVPEGLREFLDVVQKHSPCWKNFGA